MWIVIIEWENFVWAFCVYFTSRRLEDLGICNHILLSSVSIIFIEYNFKMLLKLLWHFLTDVKRLYSTKLPICMTTQHYLYCNSSKSHIPAQPEKTQIQIRRCALKMDITWTSFVLFIGIEVSFIQYIYCCCILCLCFIVSSPQIVLWVKLCRKTFDWDQCLKGEITWCVIFS